MYKKAIIKKDVGLKWRHWWFIWNSTSNFTLYEGIVLEDLDWELKIEIQYTSWIKIDPFTETKINKLNFKINK